MLTTIFFFSNIYILYVFNIASAQKCYDMKIPFYSRLIINRRFSDKLHELHVLSCKKFTYYIGVNCKSRHLNFFSKFKT